MRARVRHGGCGRALLIAGLLAGAPAAAAGDASIAIILDDLGEQRAASARAVELPGRVACAFLPHSQFSADQARRAHALGKEVLLHLPMQPGARARPHPAAITLGADAREVDAVLAAALDSIPHVRGVNNHQGSVLTEAAQHMDWLMRGLLQRGGLYFVDSRTSGRSVAFRAALAHGVPAAERSVFLDDRPGPAAARQRWDELLDRARRHGRALAIGHPYPATLALLEQELPRLAQHGVRLVAPSELIAHQSGRAPGYARVGISRAAPPASRIPAPPVPGSTSAAAH